MIEWFVYCNFLENDRSKWIDQEIKKLCPGRLLDMPSRGKIILHTLVSVVLTVCFCAAGPAFDGKNSADIAIGMPSAAVSGLESKKDKSAQDVYMLTIVYYREFNRGKLKTLLYENEKNTQLGPVLGLLQGIVLMGEHRHQDSFNILTGVVRVYPEFHPAQITLAHLSYLEKDFDRSYRIAEQMIRKKKELSRFHQTQSLLLAAGAKGFVVGKNMLRAIPAYFEVNGYFREAEKLMPDSAEVLYGMGSYRLLTPAVAGGDVDAAIALLERSRRLTPLNPTVYVRLAQAYRAKGDAASYQKNIARARELDPRDELLLDYTTGQKAFLDVP